MKNKKNWLIIIMAFVTLSCFAQKEYADKTNQYDSDGKKNGYWIEDWSSHGDKRELYYKNGVMHGNCKIYNSKGHLIWFGNFENDALTGIWYDFGDYGHLMSITKDYQKKDRVIVRKDGSKATYKYQCYYISYHSNGTIKSEGLMIWDEDEDPYLDTSKRYGEWKFYNDKGELIETKTYK